MLSENDLPGELVPVLVRAQLCNNAGMIETSFGKPRVGTLRGSFDRLAGLREIIWRFGQRTEWRHHKILDAVIKALQLIHLLARDQQGQCMQGICDGPDRRLLESAGVTGRKNDEAPRAAGNRYAHRVLLDTAPSARYSPLRCTGSNAAGTAALAMMARAAGPSDIMTVPPVKMSVATMCTGSIASSRLR